MDEQIAKIEDFLEHNNWAEDEADFVCLLDEAVDAWIAANAWLEVVEAIFALMERHPLVGFGGPGALVHFAEQFDTGYDELLEQSLERAPTVHTVLMLNRLINAATEKQAAYIRLMESIACNDDLHEEIKNAARHFSARLR